jgi:hypothetical protein
MLRILVSASTTRLESLKSELADTPLPEWHRQRVDTSISR